MDIFNEIQIGDLRNIKKCIAEGYDLEKKLKFTGYTPLIYAVVYNRLKMVIELIKAGVDVNKYDTNKYTALNHAVCFEKLEMVKELIKAGADVNLPDNKGTAPIGHIVSNHNIDLDICKELIKAGADVNMQNNNKNTPLMITIQYMNSINTEEELDEDEIGITIMCKKIITELIKAGADVNIKNKWGNSALSYAEDIELAIELLKAGADTKNIIRPNNPEVYRLIQNYNAVMPFLIGKKKKLPVHLIKKLHGVMFGTLSSKRSSKRKRYTSRSKPKHK